MGIGNNRFTSLNVPDAGCAIITSGDDVLAIGGKDGFIYQICMSLKTAQFFASGKIPKSGHAVAACCQHLLALQREDSPACLAISGYLQTDAGLPSCYVQNTRG